MRLIGTIDAGVLEYYSTECDEDLHCTSTLLHVLFNRTAALVEFGNELFPKPEGLQW